MEEIKEKSKSSKVPFLILLGVVLVGLIVLGYFIVGKESREDALSFIDSILLSNEEYLNETENMDEEIPDLSEDFLEAEVVSTDEVDSAVDDLDEQIESLGNIDTDFELDEEDVGL